MYVFSPNEPKQMTLLCIKKTLKSYNDENCFKDFLSPCVKRQDNQKSNAQIMLSGYYFIDIYEPYSLYSLRIFLKKHMFIQIIEKTAKDKITAENHHL